MLFPEPLANLISEFQKMPAIGPKSAERLAFFILTLPEREVEQLSDAVRRAKAEIKTCSICFNITESESCHICRNEFRDRSKLCVVATPK